VNGYTQDEDFAEAVLVVSELGDPGRPPIDVLASRGGAHPHDLVTLDDLLACLGGEATPAGGDGIRHDRNEQQDEKEDPA
jgi:hypothetical protein